MERRGLRERIDALARTDKWYLSGGDGILWAPPFPVWLHRPGFWDEGTVFSHELGPLFTVAAVDERGHERSLERGETRWTPSGLTVSWQTSDGVVLTEHRTVLPGGIFRSEWARKTDADGAVTLAAFSAQPGEATSEVRELGGGVSWLRRVFDRREEPLDVRVELDVRPGADGVGSLRSDLSAAQPQWELTPFVESWNGGRLAGVRDAGVSRRGLFYGCVAATLDDETPELIFSARLTPRGLDAPGFEAVPSTVESFYGRFPAFSCSDAHLERYYDYRIWGLFLNRLPGGRGNVHHPAIAEGIAYFHAPITYSAQCHMWEMRWAAEPVEARGSLLNFLDHQKEDGSFHGRIYANHLRGTDFYHADWGDGVLAVDAIAPDASFLERACTGLERYADWMDTSRDADGTGMYDVVDQFETGQEYMSRYLAVDPDADRYGWENRIRLKGIDVTVYQYQLRRALARMRRRMDRAAEARAHDDAAERVGRAILSTMWAPDLGLFCDVAPGTLTRTGVKAAVSFYPLMTDLLEDHHVERLLGHLEDPDSFGTPFPIPSSSVDDAQFHAEALWKGKRHNCPWNGRVWPMTNSHVVHGLIHQWRLGRRFVGPTAGRLLSRYVHLMFHDGDLARPNCFEHYNPFTGQACVYRGIDDYQHSWVLDLLVRGVTGIHAEEDALVVDPLPMEIDAAAIDDVRVRGRTVRVERRGTGVLVDVDGRRHDGSVGTPIEIPW